jgi:hypothetical protein
MAELLTIYQDNIFVIYNKITKLLNIFTSSSIEKFDLHSKDIEINLKEAERMLKQMDLELTTNSSIDNSEKNNFKKNYFLYKTKYENFKKTFFIEKEKYTYTKKKEEMILKEKILMQKDQENNSYEKTQILKSLERNNLSEKISSKLNLAKITAIQMENSSKNIMIDLENQGNQIKKQQLKMQCLDQNIDNSNILISKMFDRDNRNKIVFATFSIVLLSVIFWLLNTKI